MSTESETHPISSNPTTISVTDNAAIKVYELILEEGNLNLKLRVFITGGGCSGFQYGFSFDEEINEDDFEIIKKFIKKISLTAETETPSDQTETPLIDNQEAEIKLVVDAQSFAHLKGAEIDYRKDIHGEQFIIRNNPNAKTTCGCGSSFSTE